MLRSFKNLVRRSKARLKLRSLKLFSSNAFFASLYYWLFSREFRREHIAVLNGRLGYHNSLGAIGHSSALLRRNIHRLEKGLIMRPRREVFAEDYIEETVKHYVDCSNNEGHNKEEFKWANDVLTEYFSVVGDSNITTRARKQFAKTNNRSLEELSEKFKPYAKRVAAKATIEYDEFLQLCRQRRSVRWYQQKPIPETLIRQAINCATLAPSACNRQPFEFYYLDDSHKIIQVANCAMGTKGFAENIPALTVVVGDLANFPFERDRHLIYIDGALAAMQYMLALETLGLSSCPINWPDIDVREKRIAALLELKPQQRPVMLIAAGYADPDGQIPFSQKKSDQLLLKKVN